jgi:hypothetical protein
MTSASSGIPALPDEWDELSAALNAYGVNHVAPSCPPGVGLPAGRELILRLLTASDVRLQEALIPLLLTHPELADDARSVIDSLRGDTREQAIDKYVAAAALQRMWRSRIDLWLGPKPWIPDAYREEELALPSLDEEFGERTLWELAKRERARWGYNAWAGYTSLMDLFLSEIRLCGRCERRAGARREAANRGVSDRPRP